jgi:hypothetical protein
MSGQSDDIAKKVDKQEGFSDEIVFHRQEIFPEAEAIFSFRPKSLEDIVDDCLVVVDTNALLVPYTISKESLEQIRDTYRRIVSQHRLIIPAQVAREFAEHRVTKIREIYSQLSKKRIVPTQSTYPLLGSLPEYQRSIELEKEIIEKYREYSKSVDDLLEHIRNWYWNDPVSIIYGELFAEGVVAEALINKDELKQRLEKQNLFKIPPGYKDATKEDKGIGDLLIWHTILEAGEKHKKSVIFISGEEKPDWWYKSEGRTLFPRFELIDEFRRRSEGQSFHIINFSNFLKLFGASKGTVEEVKQEEETRSQDLLSEYTPYLNIGNSELSILVSKLTERMRDYVEVIRTEFQHLKEKEQLERKSTPSKGLDELVEKYFTAKVALNVKLRKGYREKFMKEVTELNDEILSRLPIELRLQNLNMVSRTPKDLESLEGIINYLDRLLRELNRSLPEDE